MTDHVIVTICGTQAIDGESETIKAIHQGKYRSLPNQDVVLYEEIMPDDAGNAAISTKNMMKITDHSLTQIKKGVIDTEMVFEPEQTHRGVYKTPYGIFDMAIHTTKLKIHKTNAAINILIQYALELNEMPVSDCTLQIEIKNSTE